MESYHVVCPRHALAAGEQVEVRLVPSPPPGTSIYWSTAEKIGMGHTEELAARAVYTAPFVIPPGSPPADIRVGLSGAQTGRVTFVGHVDLLPGSLPLSDACLAPGQSYLQDRGGIVSDEPLFLRVESVVVHMNDPEYPKMAVSRGLTDVVPVKALLCTSGRVLAAYPLMSYDDARQPIEHEPVLTDAAVAIARSREYVPLMKDGAPVANWIHVSVAFRP
jgi:hypothetical protein